MKREFLRGLGVADEHIKSILDEHYDSLRQYKEKADSADSLQEQLSAANAEIGKLTDEKKQYEDTIGDVEKQKQLLSEFEKRESDYQSEIKQLQLNSAIKLAVAKEANDANDILTLLDKDQLELSEDGTVKGLDDAINTLKESKPYLFTQVRPTGVTPPEGSNPILSKNDILSIKDDAERQNAIRENMHLFR